MQTDPQAPGVAFRYNPHLLSDAQLKGIFVGRERELQELKQALQEISPQKVPQHILLTGRRGMGKTTLLYRLSLEIRETPELDEHWLPLTFPEEQYTVSTLAEFWLGVLDALADRLEREKAPKAELEELDRAIARLQALPIEQREEQALEKIEQIIAQGGKGLVLLVDGSDLLLSNLENAETGRDKGKKGAVLWRLREVLSHHPGIFWIGASYLPLEAGSAQHYDAAFLDFFHTLELRPLSLDEIKEAMLKLAGIFGMGPNLDKEEAVEKMRRRLADHPQRLKSLHKLTNGNPRTMIVLYNLVAASDNEDILTDLDNLLDTMTPLYKSQMETLSVQQRKVFACLMDAWDPQTAADLAKAANLPVTTINSQLLRLEAQNLVEKVDMSPKRKHGYQASERFFNIWYLMRNSTRRLRNRFIWYIDFMRLWYSPQELSDSAKQYRQRFAALEYSESIMRNAGLIACTLGDHPEAYALCEQMRQMDGGKAILKDLGIGDSSEQDGREWLTLFQKAVELQEPHLYEEAEAACRKAIERGVENAGLWNDFGNLLSNHLHRYEEAEAAYRKAIELDAKYTVPWYNLGNLLIKHLHRYEEAEAAYRKAIELDAKDASSWNNLGNLLSNYLHRYEEAEAAYRKAIELDAKDAWPWYNLSILLKDLHRYEEAEGAYRKAIELDVKSALPWNGLGILLNGLHRYEEAEAAYRKAIELDAKNAESWNNLGILLSNLRRYEEAEAAYRKAIELDAKYALPWNNLGILLSNLHRYEEAEAAYRRAIEFGNSNVLIHINLAHLQIKLERSNDAKESYRKAFLLSASEPEKNAPILLQSHLFLGNRDAAQIALETMARRGSEDSFIFSRLKEQIKECHDIGLGATLANLIEQSNVADFLEPYTLALRAAQGDPNAFKGVAKEIASMAEEVYRDIFASSSGN